MDQNAAEVVSGFRVESREQTTKIGVLVTRVGQRTLPSLKAVSQGATLPNVRGRPATVLVFIAVLIALGDLGRPPPAGRFFIMR